MAADEFLRLQETHPETHRRYCQAIVEAVRRSFVQDVLGGGANIATGDETRRRTNICARIVRDLHEGTDVGKGYSPERICDELPRMLRQELDSGQAFVPPNEKRTLWVPSAPERRGVIPDKGRIILTDRE